MGSESNIESTPGERHILALAQELGPIGGYERGIDSDDAIWSDELYALFGSEKQGSAPSFANFIGFIHSQDRQRVATELESIHRDALHGALQYRIQRSDGTIQQVTHHLSAIRDASGSVIGRIGTVASVPDRSRTALRLTLLQAVSLAVAEARHFDDAVHLVLRAICHAMHSPYGEAWIPDTEAKSLDLGPVWHLGLPSLRRYAEARRDRKIARGFGHVGQAWETRQPVWVSDLSLSSPSPHLLERAHRAGINSAYVVPIVCGEEVLAVLRFAALETGVWDDADTHMIGAVAAQLGMALGRKRAEQALRESEVRFRSLIEQVTDIVLVIDADGRLKYMSRPLFEDAQHGWIEGGGRSVYELVHRDDALAFREEMQRIAGEPGGCGAGTARMRCRNARWRLMSWSCRNAQAVPGIRGIIISGRDITEARLVEERLHQAQKMEAIGMLAGGIAHDFNNLLGSIMGFAGLLAEDLPPDGELHDFVRRILQATEKGRDVVRQILSFSRLESIERVPTDLGKAVREIQLMLGASLPSSIELVVEIDPMPVIVRANAGQLSQILLNLCINARDALEDKRGRLSIRLERCSGRMVAAESDAYREDQRVIIGNMDPEASYARLVVSDTGVGMDGETLKRMFDPYYTTKEPGKGTGLGLSVLHGILLEHEGAAIVSSELGRGSRFQILLPLTQEPLAPESRPAAAGGLAKARILLVDDNVLLTSMLAVVLGRAGHQVTIENDPESALALFSDDPTLWDVVISDLNMPKLGGIELFEALRARRPDLAFILWSGYGEFSQAELDSIGIGAYIAKPAAPPDLLDAVDRVLRRNP